MWLSLEDLRNLDLEAGDWLRLLEAAESCPPPAEARLASGPRLLAEASEAEAAVLLEALERRAWTEALERIGALRQRLARLVKARPDQAEALWGRYGELLGRCAAALRKDLPAVEELADETWEEPAELCWRLAALLEGAESLPFTPPPWVAVMQRRIVQQGALLWKQLIGRRPEAEERSLDLFLRLARLVDPPPAWAEREGRRLLAGRLAAMGALEHAPSEDLLRLLGWLERLAVPEERRRGMAAALGRARLCLELLEGGMEPAGEQPELQVEPPESPAEENHPETAVEESPPARKLELVVDPDGPPLAPGRLNLAAYLDGDVDGVEDALEAFCLQEGIGAAGTPAAAHPAESLLRSLRQRGPAQQRLDPEGWSVLGAAAAAWRERLGGGVASLPGAAPGEGLWVEPDTVELELLLALLQQRGPLEQALLELRREHHHAAFWEPRPELGWSPHGRLLQALIAFHREGGFYAAAGAPLESLDAWGAAALACLGEARTWYEDDKVLGPWLALALQLDRAEGRTPILVHSPLNETLRQWLSGKEVVYVGERAEAVRRAHGEGRSFREGSAFGLRCLKPPASRYPQRPAGGFEQSLSDLVEAVDALHRERAFLLLLADGGAYRLPLCEAIRRRHGVAAIAAAGSLAGWLGA